LGSGLVNFRAGNGKALSERRMERGERRMERGERRKERGERRKERWRAGGRCPETGRRAARGSQQPFLMSPDCVGINSAKSGSAVSGQQSAVSSMS